MTDKYLLATDFDFTVCHWNDGGVSDADKAALQKFRDAGNKVAIVTGRTYDTSRWAFAENSFREFDICFCLSGALCVANDESIVYDKRADGKYLGEIIKYFRDTGARYLDFDVGVKSGRFDIGGDSEFPPTVSAEEGAHLESFTSLNAGYESVEVAKQRAAEIAALFGEVITPLQNGRAIDMPPAGINKAVAAGLAADMFGIDKKNVYTAGDNYNDIDMVAAYHGFAMDIAPYELEVAAKRKIHRIREAIDYIMKTV